MAYPIRKVVEVIDRMQETITHRKVKEFAHSRRESFRVERFYDKAYKLECGHEIKAEYKGGKLVQFRTKQCFACTER